MDDLPRSVLDVLYLVRAILILDQGQDNTSDLCIVGDVSNIFDGASGDHAGPYDGVRMGC